MIAAPFAGEEEYDDMSFELRDHTADIAIAARGDTIEEAFAQVAEGLSAAMVETVPDGGTRYSLKVSAESRDALLFDYLDELIYLRDVKNVLPVDHDVQISRDGAAWELSGTFRGVPTSGLSAREIKAVTYSEMSLEQTAEGWEVYVVFDV